MTNREVRQMALDALDALVDNHKHHQDYDEYGGYPDSDLANTNAQSITSLREALAQPEPEPVGFVCRLQYPGYGICGVTRDLPEMAKLYLAPQAPEYRKEK